jgi:opacity protein-like surface antigen
MHTGSRRYRIWPVVAVLILWRLTMVAPAWAEWSFDVYMGGAFFPNGDFTLENATSETADFKDTFVVGGRLGYWFQSVPYLGVAFDVSYLATEPSGGALRDAFDEVDLNRVLLSGLARLRLQLLRSRTVPQGHLEPYVAVGPLLSVAKLDVKVDDDTNTDIGLDARAGLNFRISRLIGVFAEYRLTWVDQTFRFSIDGVRSTVETDPTTHHLLGGLSFRF